jgi:hypothetical protein
MNPRKRKIFLKGTMTHLPNWTGLLGWSTKYHDGTSSSQFGPMNAERREWLEKALTSAFDGVEDPFKLMHKAKQEIAEGKISAGLDLLDYTSDFPDCAAEFDKVGTLSAVISLVNSPDPLVVRRALEVLNLYLPNNADVQLAAGSKYDALSIFKTALTRFRSDDEIVHSALSSIGSLIRNAESLEKGFIRENNIDFIAEVAIDSIVEHTVQKVIGIVCHLSERHDLSLHISAIENLTRIVYSRRGGAFLNENVQFWEIAAKLSQIPSLSSDCFVLFRGRLQWLEGLSADAKEDFNEEIRILSSIA